MGRGGFTEDRGTIGMGPSNCGLGGRGMRAILRILDKRLATKGQGDGNVAHNTTPIDAHNISIGYERDAYSKLR